MPTYSRTEAQAAPGRAKDADLVRRGRGPSTGPLVSPAHAHTDPGPRHLISLLILSLRDREALAPAERSGRHHQARLFYPRDTTHVVPQNLQDVRAYSAPGRVPAHRPGSPTQPARAGCLSLTRCPGRLLDSQTRVPTPEPPAPAGRPTPVRSLLPPQGCPPSPLTKTRPALPPGQVTPRPGLL